jgi:16S rRNA (uracil1498-N3)-methyltransferase
MGEEEGLGATAGAVTRLFVAPGALATGATLTLSDDERHYALRVRRRRVGDRVELLDGAGARARGELVQADGHRAEVSVHELGPAAPSVPRVEIGLGVLDSNVVPSVIAALSELGVATLSFVTTRRTQHTSVRDARVAKLVRAAQRQCGRATPLEVSAPLDLDTWLARRSTGAPLRYVAAFIAAPSPALAPATASRAALGLVGPEGGLTVDELAVAARAGFVPVRLGPWTLRAETAASALAARLLAPG